MRGRSNPRSVPVCQCYSLLLLLLLVVVVGAGWDPLHFEKEVEQGVAVCSSESRVKLHLRHDAMTMQVIQEPLHSRETLSVLLRSLSRWEVQPE